MEMRLRIMGGRKFAGDVEGMQHDFFKLRVEMPVPRKAENEFGAAQVEMKMGVASLMADFQKTYPCPAEYICDVEPNSKGWDILGIRHLDAPAKKPS